MSAAVDVMPVTEDMPCCKADCENIAVNQLIVKVSGSTKTTIVCEEHTTEAQNWLANGSLSAFLERATAVAFGMTASVIEQGGQLGLLDQTKIAELIQETPNLAVSIIAQFARLFAESRIEIHGGDGQAAYDQLCELEDRFHGLADDAAGAEEGAE
ncbi:hypothetical protein MCEMAEM6B_02141 [Mycobacteriaceae bacterium]